MLSCQKEKFSLPDDLIYLNGAYMSPNLKAVEQAGIQGIRDKSVPSLIPSSKFFEPVQKVKTLFSRLISNPEYDRIAIIPSVSYGMAIAAANASLKEGDEILMLNEQFPSNYYCWKQKADEVGASIRIMTGPDSTSRGADWNNEILNAITPITRVVTLPIVHWSDGTLFDIKRITEKAHQHDALVIIDGTQSIGAMPFDLSEIKIDALVCAAYKWLLGPYSIGCAYFAETFDQGMPIEHSWMNRLNSEDFRGLVNYESEFKAKAHRFDMGQACNFVSIPMMTAGLNQLLDWTPASIQEYCAEICQPLNTALPSHLLLEDSQYRAQHLFGIRLSDVSLLPKLKNELKSQNISVSFRGDCIRVSPNVYNTRDDIQLLLQVLNTV